MASYSISDLRDRLTLLDNKIAAAEHAVQTAERRLAEAKVERAGAEAFINLLESDGAPEQSGTHRRAANGEGISSAVLAVLEAHPEGVRTDDIPRLAAEMGGPELDGQQVRSAVKHLGRRGVAVNVRRGLWRPKIDDASVNTDGPAEAGPSDDASPPVPAEAEGSGRHPLITG
jgi:hypothetical protein